MTATPTLQRAHPADQPPRTAPRDPLVSVVILNYNYGRYLPQCIDSVLSQRYPRIEVVLVDDGSTDESREIIDRYAGRVRAIFKTNGGMVSTMNRGYAASLGEVVVFLDADDFLMPDAVGRHVDALRDPSVARSQIFLRVLQGSEPSDAHIPSDAAGEGNLEPLVLARGSGCYVSSPNSGNAWPRRFLERVMPLPEQPRSIGAETYLMDTAPLFGRVVIQRGEPLAAYRQHGASMASALRRVSAENVRRILLQYEARHAFLAGVAASLGHRPPVLEWVQHNWRLQTLYYLRSRFERSPRRPTWREHLSAVLQVQGGAVKRLCLALGIVGLRVTPDALTSRLAGRMIKLHYM